MQVDLVIAIILAAALALIVGMVSRFLTISGLKKNAESKIGNAEAKAREIIDDAVKTAETTKKSDPDLPFAARSQRRRFRRHRDSRSPPRRTRRAPDQAPAGRALPPTASAAFQCAPAGGPAPAARN